MNIKEILKENGYEIISEVEMKYFRLKFTEEKMCIRDSQLSVSIH